MRESEILEEVTWHNNEKNNKIKKKQVVAEDAKRHDDYMNLTLSFVRIVDEIARSRMSSRSINFRAMLKQFIGSISVEPAALCWLLPSCLLIIAMENLNLEKACRVNLGLGDEICRNMINKTINNINCAEFDELIVVDINNKTQDETLFNLTRSVCSAETESQKLLSVVFGLRSPIAAIFPLIIVLFAGGWSDKKGIRKPLVLLPILGELIGSLVLLMSSIFMDEIPMEVPAFSERVIPSLFGGQTLMLLGIYSYLSQMTNEENRTFRFGCFTVFLTLVPILSIPWAG